MNSLLSSFNTPYGAFPFASITPSVIEEALTEGMRLEREEVARIVANPAPPTFDNTIVALSLTGHILQRAETVMYNLSSAETSDALDDLTQRLAPQLSEHANNIMLSPELFARVKAVHDAPPADLSAEEQMLLEKTYEGFVRSGALLSECDKARFRSITAELSRLSLQFSQNLLKETNAFQLHLTQEADLDGLPAMHRAAAREAAQEKGLDGWLFTLHAPSYGPFMMFSTKRELRKKLYMAYATRCAHAESSTSNFPVVERLVNLRREMAQTLGYASYADYALRRRMAAKPAAVTAMLTDLLQRYKPQAEREVAAVAAKARAIEGDDFELHAYDFAHYAHLLKKELFDFDPEDLRPYFELSRVVEGVFGLATRLYGVTFERRTDVPTYHPEVTAYAVHEADGQYLGLLYTDFHPRESKQGGAWMTNYAEESLLDERRRDLQPSCTTTSRPHVSVVTNFTRPTATTPALLTLGEVETLLHEFGHSLHGLFAMTRFKALSGTNVYWDFVELPSQLMENYAVEPDFLATFARHYQTNEPLPMALVERIRASRTFNVAYNCLRQLSFGFLDMAFYTLSEPFAASVPLFEAEAWKATQLLPAEEGACMTVQFGHIMSGGYSAGYYSYKWAEVLDADAFALFRENGIFSRDVASSFRRHVLSQGGTAHPMKLYEAFRGRKPTIDALLARDGIQ